MLHRWFLAHPRSVGETYFGHQRAALGFAASLLKAGLACLVHAFVPHLFQRTGSRTVAELHERMILNRMEKRALPIPASQVGAMLTSAAPDRRSVGASPRSVP